MTAESIETGRGSFQMEPIIPEAFVQRLRERKAQLSRDAAKIQSEIREIDQKLNAVSILAPQHAEPRRHEDQRSLEGFDDKNSEPTTTIDAIVAAIRDSQKPLLPKEIRQAVVERGDGELLGSENYLYTALKRAVERGALRKTGGGKYILGPASEKGPDE